MIVACDNKSALSFGIHTQKHRHIDAECTDYDILMSIQSSLSPTITPKHVKGHQDVMNTPLDILAILNIHADQLANIRREQIPRDTPFPLPQTTRFPGERWQLFTGNDKVCRDLFSNIINHISSQNMAEMWQRRNRIQQENYNNVNWDAIASAMKATKHSKRLWIVKHALEECGVNTVLVKRKEKDTSVWKRCGEEETATHVWNCQAPEVQIIWQTSIEKLQKWLQESNTDPTITALITNGLLSWYNNQENAVNPDQLHNISQNTIGWQYFLEGWIAKEWRIQQARFLIQNQIANNSLRWASALIKKLWDIAWDLWEHRNGIEHMNDVQTLNIALNDKIEREIEAFDPISGHMYAYMFTEEELERLRDGTIGYKQAWLANVLSAKLRSHRRGLRRSELEGMRRLMSNFLSNRV